MKDADAAELYRKMTVHPGSKISLEDDFDPRYKPDSLNKDEAQTLLEERNRELAELQAMLYAQNTYALLIIFQALDAAGKDGTIKHVMSGVNPQGCQVYSFKAPSAEELDHDYLWRAFKALPERGRIGIFNRSYYEEVLVVRVHPEILAAQQLPPEAKCDAWKRRFEEINNFEKYLVANGVMVLKFFLNVSKEEQKKRFLERIDEPDKNWKFSVTDVKERGYWDAYMKAYEDAFNHTSTDWAPWHIIPADRKWFTWLAVSELILRKLKELDLEYPPATEDHRRELLRAKEMLDDEK
jgi:PPK2 family polyphosphate:nucleotide phosphotransferase